MVWIYRLIGMVIGLAGGLLVLGLLYLLAQSSGVSHIRVPIKGLLLPLIGAVAGAVGGPMICEFLITKLNAQSYIVRAWIAGNLSIILAYAVYWNTEHRSFYIEDFLAELAPILIVGNVISALFVWVKNGKRS